MSNSVFRVETGLYVQGSANVAGDIRAAGNFIVGGTLSASVNATGDVIPSTQGLALGNTTARWALNATTINANDVITASAGLNITGGTATITNNLVVDTTTLIVDAVNNRVGVGKAPTTALDVSGTITGTTLVGGLAWSNVTSKPSPNVVVTLTGDVTGSGNTTLTELANGTITIATTVAPNSVALGTDTTGNYAAAIAANDASVIVTGTAGEGTTFGVKHGATSTYANTTLAGGSVVVGVNTDAFGHVASLVSANLDTRFLLLTGGTMTGNIVTSGRLVQRGGSDPNVGAQIVLGYSNNKSTSILNQSNNTWNILSFNSGTVEQLRIFTQDGVGNSTGVAAFDADGFLDVTSGVRVSGATVFHSNNDGPGSGLDADFVDGFAPGNANNNIAVNNGTLNTNLNADLLDGFHATDFARLGTAAVFTANVTAPNFVGALVGNASTATTLQTARTINGVSFNGSANITVTAASPNAVTFNNGGAGAASGTTYSGSAAVTVSYNTIGAPSTTGTNASGTWPISITGTAGGISGASYLQSSGLSTSWGTTGTPATSTGAFNAVMGTATGATWILSGTSAGTFRGGIQLLDGGGTIRFYEGANFFSFSGGTLTATTFVGALNGNATTAAALQTARTVSLTGDVTGSTTFDGSANASITATVVNDSHDHTTSITGSAARWTTGRTISLSGDATGSVVVDGSANADIVVTVVNDSHDHATSISGSAAKWTTARTLALTGDVTGSATVDGSANVSITTIVTDDSHDHATSITGSAAKWTTARTITLGGDLTGNVVLDGSANVTLTATIAGNSVALGTDTTGNYVATVSANDASVIVTGAAGEGTAIGVKHGATSTYANTTLTGGSVITGVSTDVYGHIASVASANLDTRFLTLTGGVLTGQLTATNNLVVRGGGASAEGGQIVLGYGNNLATAITGQANNTWNIDVTADQTFRVLRQNGTGVVTTPLSITEVGNVTLAGGVSGITSMTIEGPLTITANNGGGGVNAKNRLYGNYQLPAPTGFVDTIGTGLGRIYTTTTTGTPTGGSVGDIVIVY